MSGWSKAPAPRPSWPVLGGLPGWLALVISAGLVVPAASAEGPPPVIVAITSPPRAVLGVSLDFVVVFRAPRANVVAVDQIVEDLDGPLLRRTTRQRRIGVVAQAFGHQAGELRTTVTFTVSGRRRLTFVLVTDEGDESDPRSIEVDIGG